MPLVVFSNFCCCQTFKWAAVGTVVRKALISYIHTSVTSVESLSPFNVFEPRPAKSSQCWSNLQWLLGALLGSELDSVEPWMHMDAKTYVWRAHVLRSASATCQMLPGNIIPGLSQNAKLLLRSKVWNVCHEGTMRIAWVFHVYVQNMHISIYI